MGLFDPTTRTLTRLGFGLAGVLFGAFGRRGRVGSRRSPDHLPAEDAPRAEAESDREEPISPTEFAERAAWERFVSALENLTEVQAVHAIDPDELGAEQVRWAESNSKTPSPSPVSSRSRTSAGCSPESAVLNAS